MDKPTVGEVEQRSTDTHGVEAAGNHIYGLIPVDKNSRDFGGWDERIEPTALDNTDLSALVATVEHDPARLLGRYDTTLKVESRSDGLAWSVELPDSPIGADVKAAVARGDFAGGSWRMVVGKDRWEGSTRVIEEIRSLRDVTVTANPAYGFEVAPVELRSFFEVEQKQTTPPVSEGSPADDAQEAPMQKDTTAGGGLTIESRNTPDNEVTVEARVLDAMASVQKGEERDITRATAQPIEPPELETYLWDRLRERSVVLASGVPVVATDREKVTWPTLTEDVSVNFYGELEAIAEDDPGFGELTIEPKKVAGLVKGSSEAFDDSDPDLLSIIQSNLVNSIALKLDSEFLAGGSSHGFPGLQKLSGVQELDMAEAGFTSYDPFVAAYGLLSQANIPGPYVAVMHPKVATSIARIKEEREGQKSNLLLPPPGNMPQTFTSPLVGVKAGTSGKPDTSTVIVYAPNSLRVVRRKETEIVVDRSLGFKEDAVYVRGIARAALGTAYPASIVLIKNVKTAAITL